jgi:hypothetical protein
MGNHVTTIFLLPVVLLPTIFRKPIPNQGKNWMTNWQLDDRSLFRRLVWLGVGLLIYFTLPLRAVFHSPVNWGNPATLDGFTWLVSGRLYHAQLLNLDFFSILGRFQAIAASLLEQFGIIGLILGLIGLIVFFKPTRLNFSMLWIAVISSGFAIGYATTDAFVYLIPAFLCFALWIGIGLGRLMDASSKRFHYLGLVVGLVFILTLFIQAWNHWNEVDASQDRRAESFGRSVLSLAPAQAIVFAKGDEAVFTLWYFLYALKDRPDLAVIATDLLQYEWYLQTLHSTYPALKLPVPFPFPETVVVANPERPLCYVRYVQAPEISCLPAWDSNSP